ncbi:MAG: hypothetical protein ACM3RP_07840, partial [Chitinophagales bacterium]
MRLRVFLGASELLGLRDSSYADPLIAVCQASGLEFSYRPDLECLFISSPAAGSLVALRVDEPLSGGLRKRLAELLRGAGAQVLSEVGLVGRRYGDVALEVSVGRNCQASSVRFPWGNREARALACSLAGALDRAGIAVGRPQADLSGLLRRVPVARVSLCASDDSTEVQAQSLFLGLTRFLWWRSLFRCQTPAGA